MHIKSRGFISWAKYFFSNFGDFPLVLFNHFNFLWQTYNKSDCFIYMIIFYGSSLHVLYYVQLSYMTIFFAKSLSECVMFTTDVNTAKLAETTQLIERCCVSLEIPGLLLIVFIFTVNLEKINSSDLFSSFDYIKTEQKYNLRIHFYQSFYACVSFFWIVSHDKPNN